MTATIRDVARRAGVSVATVSRVLNGHANVTAETRASIRSVIEELHYVPHGAAQSLVTRRTHTVGVLLPDMHGEFFSELIRGIDAAARLQGLHLLLSSSHGDLADTAAALKVMRGRVDGLLIMSPYATAQFYLDHLPPSLPAVLINAGPGAVARPIVAIDNYDGGARVAQHLHRLGRRRIALIAGPVNNHDAAERQRGFVETLRTLEPGFLPLVLHGNFGERSGYAAGQHIVALSERPDAVFAANDSMAIGCLYALNEAGVGVPEDVAVAGFDDIPIARFARPALTTVRVPIADLGTLALERLTQAMEHPDARVAETTMLRAELIARASTGAVRSGVGRLRAVDAGPGSG